MKFRRTSFIFILGSLLLVWSPFQTFSTELVIAFPSNLPPWIQEKENRGITIDLVQKSFAPTGYTLQIKYLSLKQLNQPLKEGYDAYAQVESPHLKGHYSDKLVEFQTSLISLKPLRLNIQTIDDLQDMKVIAFQNASYLFGETFHKMTKTNPNYQEMANQEIQVVQLYKGQTDVILVDRNIFLYFRRITSKANTSMPVTYHHIPGLTELSATFVLFRDEKIRDAFNKGLSNLRERGEYADIVYHYLH